MRIETTSDESEMIGGQRYYARLLVRAPTGSQAYGVIEAYVCAECGWYEEYVVNAQHIPWAAVGATRHQPVTSPYR